MTDESEEKISDNVIDRYEGASSVEFMAIGSLENYDGEERKYEQYIIRQVLRIATVGLMFVLFVMMIGDGNTISKSLGFSLLASSFFYLSAQTISVVGYDSVWAIEELALCSSLIILPTLYVMDISLVEMIYPPLVDGIHWFWRLCCNYCLVSWICLILFSLPFRIVSSRIVSSETAREFTPERKWP